MSEAPQLPTPSLRHSRFAKSNDGVSSQRDVREKRKKHSFERRSRAADDRRNDERSAAIADAKPPTFPLREE
jgi:hypothetical protein